MKKLLVPLLFFSTCQFIKCSEENCTGALYDFYRIALGIRLAPKHKDESFERETIKKITSNCSLIFDVKQYYKSISESRKIKDELHLQLLKEPETIINELKENYPLKNVD